MGLAENKEKKETQVVEIIRELRLGDNAVLEDFFNLYSDDIYNFPIRNFRFSEDEAGDFYLFVFEKLQDGEKLRKFEGKSSFRTWFFRVLRNFTIDFIRFKRSRSIQERVINNEEVLGNLVVDSFDQEKMLDNPIMDVIDSMVDELTPYERVLFKLVFVLYTFFSEEDIQYLIKISGKKKDDIVVLISDLRDEGLKKTKEHSAYEESVSFIFMDILRLEKILQSFFEDHRDLENNPSSWSENYENAQYPPEITDLIQKLARKKKTHGNMVLHYRKTIGGIRAPYKKISELLNTTDKVASVQFLRILQKLDQKLTNSGFF